MPEATDKISLGPWFKGVDYSRPASELDANTLFACENVRVGNAGQGDKRQGSAPVHASAINSGATVTAIGQQKFSASSSATFGFVGNKFSCPSLTTSFYACLQIWHCQAIQLKARWI
jgi:hypothetical protein